jgi:hypothetical protein
MRYEKKAEHQADILFAMIYRGYFTVNQLIA